MLQRNLGTLFVLTLCCNTVSWCYRALIPKMQPLVVIRHLYKLSQENPTFRRTPKIENVYSLLAIFLFLSVMESLDFCHAVVFRGDLIGCCWSDPDEGGGSQPAWLEMMMYLRKTLVSLLHKNILLEVTPEWYSILPRGSKYCNNLIAHLHDNYYLLRFLLVFYINVISKLLLCYLIVIQTTCMCTRHTVSLTNNPAIPQFGEVAQIHVSRSAGKIRNFFYRNELKHSWKMQ